MNEILFKFLNSFAGHSVLSDKVIIFFATTFAILTIIFAAAFLFWHMERRAGENAWVSFVRKVREITFVFIVAIVAWGV